MAMEVFRLVGRITYEGQQTVERGLQRLGQRVDAAAERLTAFGERAQEIGEQTKAIGEGFTANVTAPLAALGAAGMLAANDVEQAYAKIEAQTGATGKELEAMEKQAKSLWRNGFGENVEAAGQALVTVKNNMVDMPIEMLEKAAEKAYILQDAFGVELADSTAVADQMMLNFGLSADEAFDTLTTGFQNGLDYGADFVDTIREYGPIFAEAGMEANDMLSFMETAQAAGFRNLDVAADTFKEFSLLSSEGSEEFAAAVAAMGKETQALYKGFQEGKVSGQDLFYGISSGLKNIEDPTERFNLGVATMGTLFEDNTENMIMNMSDMRAELETTAGATEAAGEALYDTFAAKLTGAIRTVQDALLPIGNILMDILEPAVAKFATKVQDLANWFGSLSAENQKFIVILGIIAAAIGPVLVVVGTLISSIGAIVTAVGAVGLVTVGWIAGIGLLIAAVVAAYMQFEGFRNGVNAVFVFIKDMVMLAMGAIAAFVGEKVAQIRQFWEENGAMIMQAVQNVWSVISAIISAVMPIILAIISSVWNSIKGLISGVLNFIMGLIKMFAGLLTGDFSAMWEGIKQMFSGALQAIWNYMNIMFIGRMLSLLKSFAVSGFNLVVGLGRNIGTAFSNMWNSAASLVSGGVSKVVGFFRKLGDDAGRIFSILRQTGDNVFRAIYNTITSIASNIGSKVASTFSSMKDKAVSAFQAVQSRASSIFNSVRSAIENPIRTAVNFVRDQVAKIKGFFSGLKISLPKIKLPHFSIKGEFSLMPPRVPTLDIDWYKKGGVFGSASVIGVGEEPGVQEAVIPLKKSVLQQIGEGIAAAGGSGGGSGNMPPLLVQLVMPDMRILAEQLIDPLDRELNRQKTTYKRFEGDAYL